MNRLLLMGCLLITVNNQLCAQGKVEVRAGLSFPIGNFAYDNISNPFNNAGGARIGFDIGGTYIHKIQQKDFSVFLSTDFIYNGLSLDAKDIFESSIRAEIGQSSNLDITFFKYINLPIITGMRYTYNLKDKAVLFGDVGLGANFLSVSDMNIIYDNGNEEVEITYDQSTQFAFKLQAGVLIRDKYTLGLNYLNLGSHRIESELTEDGQTEDYDDLKRSIAMVTLSFAILF